MKRKLYSCKVRLGGSLLHEVQKEMATAAEIQLLRVLHSEGGAAPVVEIVHTHNVERSDATERARLAGIYSMTDPQGTKSGAELVHRYFGLGALPNDVPEPEEAVIDETGESEVVKTLEEEEFEAIEPAEIDPRPVVTRTRRVPPRPVENVNALTA